MTLDLARLRALAMAAMWAMDPPTTLALLDRLEAAEALIVELQDELKEQYETINRLQR
jgi:hypothetical protein